MWNSSGTKFGRSGVNIRDDHFVFATHRFRRVELFLGISMCPQGCDMSKLSATKFGCSGVNIRDDHFVFATHRFRRVELFFGMSMWPQGCGYVEVVGN